MSQSHVFCSRNRWVAILAFTAMFVCDLWAAPKYKVLHAFRGGSDGDGPYGQLILDQKGNIYGTTAGGGKAKHCNQNGGCGTVFELSPQTNGVWKEAILHGFRWDGHDGYGPRSGVTLDAAGHVYGTTLQGGSHDKGVVFELTRGSQGWNESILYNFCEKAECKDGGSPWAGLTLDKSGSLYGTAGLVFELTHGSAGWQETVLYTFCRKPNCRDGADPIAGLISDSVGRLYGTTIAGGNYPPKCGGSAGCGVAFELSPESDGRWKERTLHRFANFPRDGWVPSGPLAMDHAGHLYGTTAAGGGSGCEGGCGTVYELSPAPDGRWKETLLNTFGDGNDGASPQGGVVLDDLGHVYGVTALGGGGTCGCGVVYQLTHLSSGKWEYSVLHTFTGNDGAMPVSLIMDENNNTLYGTTPVGGKYGNGVVFQLMP